MDIKEINIISDSLVEASKLGTVNALGYIKNGFETYKKVEIPIVSSDGQYCYGIRKPYEEDKEIQTFVDFMLVYLDEAIKIIDKKDKSE